MYALSAISWPRISKTEFRRRLICEACYAEANTAQRSDAHEG